MLLYLSTTTPTPMAEMVLIFHRVAVVLLDYKFYFTRHLQVLQSRLSKPSEHFVTRCRVLGQG